MYMTLYVQHAWTDRLIARSRYEYSWILGAEINQPFYAKNPAKFAPWNFAKRAVFYPSVFEQEGGMTVPVVTPHGNSTLIFLHFLAYVRGAAGVPELPQWRPTGATAVT